MTKVGLISDTHGYMDDRIIHHFQDRDAIFHAGDIGNMEVMDKLASISQLYGVFGNIDGQDIRQVYPEELQVKIEGYKIFMIHIGGYPGKYQKGIKQKLKESQPNLYICGHSHILKVMPDKELGLLHINPGAAGTQGFHKKRTLIKFEINNGKAGNMQVVELNK